MGGTATLAVLFGRKLGELARNRRAVAAVEFAIIMPVLTLFLLGGAEIARFVNTARAIESLVYAEANLVAERPLGAIYLATNDVIFGEEATPLIFPGILADSARKGMNSTNQSWMQDIQFTISSVTFTPTVIGCTSGCTYTAAVTWSYAQNASKRSCIVPPTKVSDTSVSSLTTLPSDVYTSGTLIVVDIAYQYTPVFGGNFVSPIWIRRSAYLQPRYNDAISFLGVPSC